MLKQFAPSRFYLPEVGELQAGTRGSFKAMEESFGALDDWDNRALEGETASAPGDDVCAPAAVSRPAQCTSPRRREEEARAAHPSPCSGRPTDESESVINPMRDQRSSLG